jgi:hypothetical protein
LTGLDPNLRCAVYGESDCPATRTVVSERHYAGDQIEAGHYAVKSVSHREGVIGGWNVKDLTRKGEAYYRPGQSISDGGSSRSRSPDRRTILELIQITVSNVRIQVGRENWVANLPGFLECCFRHYVPLDVVAIELGHEY